jgi:hypothetical protein
MSKAITFQPQKRGDHVRQGDVLVIWQPGIKLGKKLPHEKGAAVLAHGEVTACSPWKITASPERRRCRPSRAWAAA